MDAIKRKYSPESISKVRDILESFISRNTPQEYKILVDGAEAVPRTENIDLFEIHEEFIDEETSVIEVFIYSSPKNPTHYILSLNNDADEITSRRKHKETGLSGIELENKIQSVVIEEKKKWDKENEQKRILEENQFLKKENAELEKENEELEEQVDELTQQLQSARSPLHGMLGQLGSTLIETVAKRNQHLLKLIPGGEALNGFLLSENENKALQTAEQMQPETEVSFRPKDEPQPTTKLEDLLTEDDKLLLTLIRQLRFAFDEQEMSQVMQILSKLVMDKTNIPTVLELLAEAPDTNDTENSEDHE
jgi:cell division protein FtsB